MKSNPTIGILGFFLSLGFLMILAQSQESHQSQIPMLALAVACWCTEYRAVRRRPSDFSCGFVFSLILALMGQGLAAMLLLLSAAFTRQMKSGTTYPWDLVWTAPSLIILSLAQARTDSWAESPDRLAWSVGALVLAFVVHYFGSLASQSRYSRRAEDHWQVVSVEKEHRNLRLLVLPYAAVALMLPESSGGLVVAALPLCLALQNGVQNVGFRVQAQAAEFKAAEATESKRELAQVANQLDRVSQKQRLMEELVKVFEQALNPEEVFEELCNATESAVQYRSIVLFRLTEDGKMEPYRHSSPEAALLGMASLVLRVEPLVEKAWLHDRPFRGMASTAHTQRLVLNEAFLVAIPLKPFGVLYFGRDRGEPFSKVEASKLLFISKRAESAFIRAEQAVRTETALKEQEMKSEVLQTQVALTSRLLEASQAIMTAPFSQKLAEVVRTTLADSNPDCAGSVEIGAERQILVTWGNEQLLKSCPEELTVLVTESARPLYFSDLASTRFAPETGPLRSIILAPLSSGSSCFGLLRVASSSANFCGKEMHDFICTLACLAGGGLESLQLSSELQQAHEQVVQASKLSAIGQLAAGVAHELNTPLAAIALAIESASIRPESAAETLLNAEKAVERAQMIVAGLLKHSRQKDADRELIDLSLAFQELAETMTPRLREREQNLLMKQGPGELKLLASSSEIQQILSNLVLNASDASPTGAEIRLFAFSKDDLVHIELSDQGEGIPDDLKGRVFEPFFTTKPVGKGTGLGLSVSRELVHRHHGKMDFRANPEGGTTFFLSFPARASKRHSVLD